MPPQAGIPQRLKQLAQGFLGVNLRRDRVTLADEELAKAINADLHERPGSILLRRGRRKQFGSALSDTAIRRLALVNGVRYQIAGQSVYRDAAAILSGTLSATLFTTLQAARPLADRTLWVFIADEAAMYKDNGTSLVPWGIAVPSVPVAAVGAIAGNLTGDYLAGYTYIRFDDEDEDGEPAVAHESNPAESESVTLSSGTLAIGDIANPSDTQVNGIGVYRSVADGALLLLDSREEIPSERTTFTVTHGWEVTATPGGTAADGLQMHWTLDKGTMRGTQEWEPEIEPGLRFISGEAVLGDTMTLPEHAAGDLLVIFAYRNGSTQAPAVPSGWSTWGTGSGANLNASVGGYKVATSDSETSGEWTGATGLDCHVYRGQSTTDPIGANGDTGAASTQVTYPALDLEEDDGTSIVVGFAGHRATNTRLETAPSGMTNRTNVVGPTSSVGEIAGHDSGGVSIWLAKTVSVGGTTSGWRARTLEIKADGTSTSTEGESEDANGYRGTHLWESVQTIPVTFVSDTNLISNGTFDTDLTGWTTLAGSVSWDAGRMLLVSIAANAHAEQAVTTVAGTSYLASVDLTINPGDTVTLHVGTASGGSQITSGTRTASGTLEVLFTASGTTTYIGISNLIPNGAYADNVRVREITSGTPTPPVTTQTLNWAYASIIADSALGAQAPTDNAVPPRASWVTEFQGHLFLTRDPTARHTLYWSTRFAPEAWPEDNFLEIGSPDDPIQCAMPIAGILGVLTRSTKYRVAGNAVAGFQAQEALSRRGTPCPLACIASEYGLVFPHHDGIFRTNFFQQDEELSAEIAPLFYGETVNDMPPINWAAAQTFAAAYRKGRYYFAYASGDHTAPDTLAVLSRTTGKWYFFDHPARSLYVEEGEDEILTAGFTDGFVYVLEEGDSDAGDDMALDVETKDYFGPEPDVRKLMVFARVDAEVPSGETLSVDMYVDGTLKRTASVTGTRTRILLPFPESSMGYTWRLGFRYTGSERIRVYGASVIMLPLEAS